MAWSVDVNTKSTSSAGGLNSGFNPVHNKGIDEKTIMIALGAVAVIYIAYTMMKKGR